MIRKQPRQPSAESAAFAWQPWFTPLFLEMEFSGLAAETLITQKARWTDFWAVGGVKDCLEMEAELAREDPSC